MDKLKGVLERLGFGDKEITIYLALLGKGDMQVSRLAQVCRLHRPAVYSALATLEARSLVSSYTAGKQPVYRAESPQALKEDAEELVETLETELSRLDARTQKNSPPAVRILTGKSGIRFVFADLVRSLPRGGMFFRYTSERNVEEVNKYLPRKYRELRDNKHLERQVISNIPSGSKKKFRLERGIRFIPRSYDLFEQNVIELIYGSKVAIIDLNTETSILMENKAIADFHTKLFKLLYSKLPAQ